MKNFQVLILLLCILVITACTKDGSEASTGHLHISINLEDAQSRTLTGSQELRITTYEIIGEGPEDASFHLDSISSTEVVIEELPLGDWEMMVLGFDDQGNLSAEDADTLTIEPGTTSQWNAMLLPLIGPGDIMLTVQWPEELDAEPEGKLICPTTDDEYPLTYDGTSLFASDIPSGYYTLQVSLEGPDARIWGNAYSVRILANRTTELTLNVSEESMDLTGLVEMQIASRLFNPLEFTLQGVQQTFSTQGLPMELTIDIPLKDDDVTHTSKLYMNGELTIEGDTDRIMLFIPEPGLYMVSVLVFAQNDEGTVLRAGHSTFAVTAE